MELASLSYLLTSAAKRALVAAEEALESRNKTIQDLLEELEAARSPTSGPRMVKGGDAYFDVSVDAGASGDPYCVRCWEQDREKSHLTRVPKELLHRVCPRCKHTVSVRGIHDPRGRGPHKALPTP